MYLPAACSPLSTSSPDGPTGMISPPLSLQQRLDLWMRRRLPVQEQITLDQGRIFIVPTKLSLGMLGLVMLIFLLGNLFQNTMAYSVSFWLLALQVISIFYTFRNLSGIQVKPAGSSTAFAGERVTFNYRISHTTGRAAHNMTMGWRDQDATTFNLAADNEIEVQLSYQAPERGLLRPEKIEIQTRYPTGLAVAWSYLRFDMEAIVYPKPLEQAQASTTQAIDCADEDGHANTEGVTNFAGVKSYQHGDSPRRIHWAKYAQTGELYTKHFEDNQSHEHWLQWSEQQGDTEQRLSRLCAQVLQAHESNERYGLKLPTQELKPSSGAVHRDSCLRALALYNVEPTRAQSA